MRRTILTILAALVVMLALASAVVAAQGSDSTVTRPRLERSVASTFANLYARRASIQGRPNVTPESLNAQAMCGKAGATNVDLGPGADWVCLMSWTDPEVPMPPEGYGKFELNVHSNNCFTASSPSKLTGFVTMTDRRGVEVPNPVFEFDTCFDPSGPNRPTGVIFPSLLTITSTTLTADPQGRVGVQVTCGTGDQGCAGTVSASAGGRTLGSLHLGLREETTGTLLLPGRLPDRAGEVSVTVALETGFGPLKPVTIAVQQP